MQCMKNKILAVHNRYLDDILLWAKFPVHSQSSLCQLAMQDRDFQLPKMFKNMVDNGSGFDNNFECKCKTNNK